jgi:hypothetical protein
MALMKKYINLLAQVQNEIVTESRPFRGLNVILWRKVEFYKEWTNMALFRATINFSQRQETHMTTVFNDHTFWTSKCVYKCSQHCALLRETDFSGLN